MIRPESDPTPPPKAIRETSSGSNSAPGEEGLSGPDSRVSLNSRVPLSELPAGTRATIDLDAADERLEAEDREVLRAMGFAHRASVRICRQGEPCIVEVESSRVGLSRVLAAGLDAIPAPRAS